MSIRLMGIEWQVCMALAHGLCVLLHGNTTTLIFFQLEQVVVRKRGMED